ncbi:MAG: type I glyceraldehyde-3-phosphate dehydrogenase [Bacteroidetes bacterium]|nr:MAG: type I glyceraldehyde-3-phosphate dehydrogenase [Bacteroidota bacterium]
MKKIRVAINGFGRIGRTFCRVALSKPNHSTGAGQVIEIVGINDLADSKTLSHLFKYDSVHRIFQGEVKHGENFISIDGSKINVTAEKDPGELPWRKLGVDVVIESTGHFLDKESAGKHLKAGAKKVIISAPAKGDVKSIVLGVNDSILSKDDTIISNASCTTNCAAPMIKVLDENWGIEDAYISTIHSYTGDQRLHDAPHKDLRRARAAALSIIPTSTGAAKAITKIFPHLEGRMGGCGMRVPVPNGSLTDISCILKKNTTTKQINDAFRKAAETSLKGILQYTEEPLVSVDIIGNPYSCVLDAEFTSVVGRMVKVIGWYDNEMGYSNRLADLVEKIS